jgi:hypothetical protein
MFRHNVEEHTPMSSPTISDSDVADLARASMRWYGWGSPIGLGLFIVCLSLAGLVTAQTVRTATDVVATGTHAGLLQPPDGRR